MHDIRTSQNVFAINFKMQTPRIFSFSVQTQSESVSDFHFWQTTSIWRRWTKISHFRRKRKIRCTIVPICPRETCFICFMRRIYCCIPRGYLTLSAFDLYSVGFDLAGVGFSLMWVGLMFIWCVVCVGLMLIWCGFVWVCVGLIWVCVVFVILCGFVVVLCWFCVSFENSDMCFLFDFQHPDVEKKKRSSYFLAFRSYLSFTKHIENDAHFQSGASDEQ